MDSFQEDGTNIYQLTQNQFADIERKIRNELNQWKSRIMVMSLTNLNHFSPWMANYNIRKNLQTADENNINWLEVPGQYNNVKSRPFPHKHIKIFTFDSNVQVLHIDLSHI